jgi:hypothetical protein
MTARPHSRARRKRLRSVMRSHIRARIGYFRHGLAFDRRRMSGKALKSKREVPIWAATFAKLRVRVQSDCETGPFWTGWGGAFIERTKMMPVPPSKDSTCSTCW